MRILRSNYKALLELLPIIKCLGLERLSRTHVAHLIDLRTRRVLFAAELVLRLESVGHDREYRVNFSVFLKPSRQFTRSLLRPV